MLLFKDDVSGESRVVFVDLGRGGPFKAQQFVNRGLFLLNQSLGQGHMCCQQG